MSRRRTCCHFFSMSSSENIEVPTAVLGDDDDDDDYFVNNNIDILTGKNHHDVISHKMWHHCGGAILPVHWRACKAVLAFHAGSRVSNFTRKTTSKTMIEAACLEIYLNAIDALDQNQFDKPCREYFSHSFQSKHEPMTAHSLYEYYLMSRKIVRNQFIPYLRRKLDTMKSPISFDDCCNEVVVDGFRGNLRLPTKQLHWTVISSTQMRTLKTGIHQRTGSSQNPHGRSHCW